MKKAVVIVLATSVFAALAWAVIPWVQFFISVADPEPTVYTKRVEIDSKLKSSFPVLRQIPHCRPTKLKQKSDIFSTWGIALFECDSQMQSETLRGQITEKFRSDGWHPDKDIEIELSGLEFEGAPSNAFRTFLNFSHSISNGKGKLPTKYLIEFKLSNDGKSMVANYRVDSN